MSRGRPKGSTSFINVKLDDLNKYLRPEMVVPVSVVWLKNLGINAEHAQITISESRQEENFDQIDCKEFDFDQE